MSDLFGNHIVGFPTRWLKSVYLHGHVFVIYGLTSFPMRSSLFSTIPQGAMPMATILFLAFNVLSLIASPTCRVTPEITSG